MVGARGFEPPTLCSQTGASPDQPISGDAAKDKIFRRIPFSVCKIRAQESSSVDYEEIAEDLAKVEYGSEYDSALRPCGKSRGSRRRAASYSKSGVRFNPRSRSRISSGVRLASGSPHGPRAMLSRKLAPSPDPIQP